MSTPKTITAAEADQLAGGEWFEGYTKTVELHETAVALDDFNAESRASARGNTEYVVFAKGLAVEGTLDLASDVHSIYVVLGDLTATRVILGDAVLVVTGKLVAREWVFGPATEGLFALAGEQIESNVDAVLAAIDAPTVVMFDRNARKYVLRVRGERRDQDQLVPELLDDGDVRHRELRKRVLAGEPLFAG